MALTNFTQDMDIIAKLADEPNVDDGLTSAQLKAKFDEGGKAIQSYINGTLKDFVDSLESGTGLADGSVTTPKIANKNVTKAKLEDSVQDSLDSADTAYQKPASGIPQSDLDASVQTCLGKADSAYQKPSSGIPAADLAAAVRTLLGKANTALQAPPSPSDGQHLQYDATNDEWVAVAKPHSVPSGGTTGQVLAKKSGTDYDTEWVDQSGGGGSVDIYWATYNETSYFTLGTKFSGAQLVACKYDDKDYVLTHKISSSDYIFTCVDKGKVYWLENNNNTWSNGSVDINAVTSVNGQTGAVSLSIPSSAADVGAVASSQGVAHAGEFLVVGNDGNVTTVTMTAWSGGSY